MKTRIAGLTAVLALAFVAPASAHFYSPPPFGSADNRHVSAGEACFAAVAGAGSYHGGIRNCGNLLAVRSYSTWHEDVKIGLRGNDGALLYAWVATDTSLRYRVDYGHQ